MTEKLHNFLKVLHNSPNKKRYTRGGCWQEADLPSQRVPINFDNSHYDKRHTANCLLPTALPIDNYLGFDLYFLLDNLYGILVRYNFLSVGMRINLSELGSEIKYDGRIVDPY
jgi:hypothetical protein